jgi:RNA-binding protein
MLDKDKKKAFVVEAHALKPVVMIGNKGLTDNILAEIDIALNHHELIKIKIAADRDAREILTNEIIEKTGAELIQSIGQTATIYREKPEEEKKPKRKPQSKAKRKPQAKTKFSSQSHDKFSPALKDERKPFSKDKRKPQFKD